MTNVLHTSTGKQIVGGLLGMGVAGLLYMGIGQVSDQNLKGLLVSTDTVSDTAGQVSINDEDASDATIRRLASRAQTVAAELEKSQTETAPAIATTPLNERAVQRGADRVVSSSIASALANAPTYDVNPNAAISEVDRLAIRNARFAAAPSSAPTQVAGIQGYTPPPQIIERVVPVDREVIREVPVEVIREVIREVPVDREVIKEVQVPVDREVIREVIKEVPVTKEVIKEVIKEVPVPMYQPQPSKGYTPTYTIPRPLPDSGPGLIMVAGSSMLAAAGVLRRKKSSV